MSDISPSIPTAFENLQDCEFILIGEAPGAREKELGFPFVGQSGKLLTNLLETIGIPRSIAYITNVFWTRPPDNDVGFFFAGENDNIEICQDLPAYRGKYLKEEWRSEIERLELEIKGINPKIIVTVGATPLWALTGKDKISMVRGEIIPVGGPMKDCAHLKVLPTYHPAYILRNRSNMPILKEDLELAKAQLTKVAEENTLFEF